MLEFRAGLQIWDRLLPLLDGSVDGIQQRGARSVCFFLSQNPKEIG